MESINQWFNELRFSESISSLAFEKFLLPLQPPTISTQTLVSANYAMAGDDQCGMVACTCARHRAHRFRFSNRVGDLLIRTRLAKRNASQFFPHTPLKRGRLNVEWKINVRRLAVKPRQHLIKPQIQT